MLDFFNTKQKVYLGLIGLATISALIAKGVIDINNYKILKRLNKKLLKYSWEYYE